MQNPIPVLFDLNIDGDCTNLCSLAILNILANKGEARILATTACFKSPLATGCIKALNHYYGNDDIPVGILHRQEATHPTPFMEHVNRKFRPEHPDGEEAPDTVEVMRKALAKEPDESVTMVISGCFASFAALLQSPADAISPLSGQELAERKICRMVVMAGSFETLGDKRFPENNVIVQVPAAQYVTEHWKKELVLTAYEIGDRVRSLREFRLHGSDEHPLKMMYDINNGSIQDFLERGNPSWDQTAVLEGVRPGRYFNYYPWGHIRVTDDGLTIWEKRENGKQTYLLPKEPFTDIAKEIEEMIENN